MLCSTTKVQDVPLPADHRQAAGYEEQNSAEISQGTIRCLMATFSACRQQTLRAMQGIGEAMLHQSPKT